MLDIKFIRENANLVKEVARFKNIDVNIDELLKLDDKRRKINQKIEKLRTEKNQFSKHVGTMAENEKQATLKKMQTVDAEQGALEEELKPLQDKFMALMFKVPMIIDERTPIGADDTGNKEISVWGDKPKFDFPIKDHVTLGEELDIFDIERAVKIGGSRSYILKGDGARLEAAVLKYAEDFISRKNYTLMSVPVIVDEFALFGTGYFPGGEEQIYSLERDNKYLVGTSEVSLGTYYANEILDEAQLPIRLAGFSVCFRREAGTYGKDTRGIYRVHQFYKVEQFIIGKNDDEESKKLHEELLGNSEEFLKSLHLPYRVLNICTGDMGQGKYYMNDIETWMPSRNSYGETHSCSTLHDFQARRLNLRYKGKDGRVYFCHTLNNTVIATPRILIPLIESNQTKDGNINIPEALRSYMDNQETIKRK